MTEQKQLEPVPVVWLPANTDACALYRMYIPYLSTPRSQYLYSLGPIQAGMFAGAKVAVVQRQVSDFNKMALLRIKEAGLKIVYDLDDNIWSLPAYNPGKKTFDIHQDGFRQCAQLADILTVSTIGLATAAKTGFKLFDKEIFVVPNAVNFDLFKQKKMNVNDDLIFVGWGGSNTHSQDTAEAFDAVCEVLETNPKVRMKIIGAPAVDVITESRVSDSGYKQQRKATRPSKISYNNHCRFTPWVPIGEYGNRMSCWGWDIALAPLEDNRFNRSKSNIKCLEAASIRIPCLCSDVQPYNEFCSLGGSDLKWLLCNSRNDWIKKLNILVNDKAIRDDLGNKMYDVAFKFFNIEKIKYNWQYIFQRIAK
jgi:glycosyltransferase involved in cell wall biosynthesis